MKTLLLQRLCSSFASGKATAAKLLCGDVLEDEDKMPLLVEPLSALTPTEAGHLRTIIEELSRPEARDPKLAAVPYFFTEHRTEGKTWREHGCIIFSQYCDTAQWVAAALAQVVPDEPVARVCRHRQEIEDDWLESAEKLEAMMDQYIHLRQRGRDVFELHYKETIDPDKNLWELCSRVLTRKDVIEKLSASW